MRGVVPGQVVCVYGDDGVVIGGGVIDGVGESFMEMGRGVEEGGMARAGRNDKSLERWKEG